MPYPNIILGPIFAIWETTFIQRNKFAILFLPSNIYRLLQVFSKVSVLIGTKNKGIKLLRLSLGAYTKRVSLPVTSSSNTFVAVNVRQLSSFYSVVEKFPGNVLFDVQTHRSKSSNIIHFKSGSSNKLACKTSQDANTVSLYYHNNYVYIYMYLLTTVQF